MLDSFQHQINSKFRFLKEKRLLIAVSGGLDSVVLTYLCHQLNLNVSLAHCNFKLRNDESDGDEDFVIELAKNLGLEMFCQSFNTTTYANDQKISIQMAARKLRYEWFHQLKSDHHFDYILTAHHADDNLETMLINLMRGTGIDGLTGIPEINGAMVRPLLAFSRKDIEAYARDHQLSWREDSSNASLKYLRNELRHEVIPLLKNINPSLIENSIKTISHLKNTQYLVSEHIATKTNEFINQTTPSDIRFDCEKLRTTDHPMAYLYELLKSFGFTEWNDVEALLTAQTGKMVYSETHQLLKNRNELILSKKTDQEDSNYRIDENDGSIELPDLQLTFEKVSERHENSETCIYIDYDQLLFPVKMRNKRDGDYCDPIGMTGKKKVSKYFKDQKLSLNDKDRVWLLLSGETVVWVMGQRADERFKVTDNTTTILKIELVNYTKE